MTIVNKNVSLYIIKIINGILQRQLKWQSALGSKYPHKKLGMVVDAIIPVLGKQDKVDHQAY